MILRLSSPATRAFLVTVALAFATGLSYSGIRNTLAVHDAERTTPEGYERAIQLEPDDARNWYLLGRYWQYNLEDPNNQRAIRAYQTALSFDSHSADTWLDLATAYESEGDVAAARNAFLQATRVYSLSPEVSWRFGNFLLRRGENRRAARQLAAIGPPAPDRQAVRHPGPLGDQLRRSHHRGNLRHPGARTARQPAALARLLRRGHRTDASRHHRDPGGAAATSPAWTWRPPCPAWRYPSSWCKAATTRWRPAQRRSGTPACCRRPASSWCGSRLSAHPPSGRTRQVPGPPPSSPGQPARQHLTPHRIPGARAHRTGQARYHHKPEQKELVSRS